MCSLLLSDSLIRILVLTLSLSPLSVLLVCVTQKQCRQLKGIERPGRTAAGSVHVSSSGIATATAAATATATASVTIPFTVLFGAPLMLTLVLMCSLCFLVEFSLASQLDY